MTTAPPSPVACTVEGLRRRDAAHVLLAARRAVHVRRGQRALLGQLLRCGSATADDVRGLVQLPADIDPRCLGTVPVALARADIIRAAGYVRSTRPAAHARPVLRWQLADRAAALAWLATHPELPDIELEQLDLYP
jgi:hypothetical protein